LDEGGMCKKTNSDNKPKPLLAGFTEARTTVCHEKAGTSDLYIGIQACILALLTCILGCQTCLELASFFKSQKSRFFKIFRRAVPSGEAAEKLGTKELPPNMLT
jgi:hypothetical protein